MNFEIVCISAFCASVAFAVGQVDKWVKSKNIFLET